MSGIGKHHYLHMFYTDDGLVLCRSSHLLRASLAVTIPRPRGRRPMSRHLFRVSLSCNKPTLHGISVGYPKYVGEGAPYGPHGTQTVLLLAVRAESMYTYVSVSRRRARVSRSHRCQSLPPLTESTVRTMMTPQTTYLYLPNLPTNARNHPLKDTTRRYFMHGHADTA